EVDLLLAEDGADQIDVTRGVTGVDMWAQVAATALARFFTRPHVLGDRREERVRRPRVEGDLGHRHDGEQLSRGAAAARIEADQVVDLCQRAAFAQPDWEAAAKAV